MNRGARITDLEDAIGRVVAEGNCSGCGACASVLPGVKMGMEDGFLRPHVTGSAQSPSAARARARDRELFEGICPGVSLRAPARRQSGSLRHPVFGRYEQAWQGSAVDPAIRRAGSSGGVLTALSQWLIDTGQVHRVLGAAMDPVHPTRTVPLFLTTRELALASTGSRYAPVSVAACPVNGSVEAVVGKPCEVAALRTLHRETDSETPVLLSFFCAGTPSQTATDDLVSELGHNVSSVTSLRYRGEGWPGEFVVESDRGRSTMSYDQSWGAHLGRRIQDRCKICVDGTGEFADIAVGDFWEADDRGFPVFADAPGNSVVIARTERGRDLLVRAEREGVVDLHPVDLDVVLRVQPLQRARRTTVAARLIGRRLAGFAVPRYRGFGLWRSLVRHPLMSVKAARGTRWRSLRQRRAGS